ncbi:MAG: DNA primase [Actinomycetota bacterium]
MGIVDEDVVRVRESTDVVAVISEYTQLRKSGLRFQGLCPFHSERTGSFSVNADEGLYHCFGCGVGGDIITFVREKEQLDFVSAVEWLAAKANITLRYTDSGQGEERKRKTVLTDALERAVEWYHSRLLSSDDAGPARGYLRQRGYNSDVVRRYQIGWAPESWDALSKSLRLPDSDLVDSGLGMINRFGRQTDAFRGRIVFPIYDPQGKPVGFGGRIMPGGDGPKYKNSAESSIYAKSRVLYGLHLAKTAIVEADEVIVCEGYTDVIGFARAGAPRAVATCGTALTEEHVKLLRRFAKRVVLAFDADAAGQNAAARFYEWEKAHDLDVAVVAMPPGVDPGELAQDDPAALVTAVEDARSFLDFRVERAINAADRSTNEGRAKAAERALEMVREHPDPLVRDQYAVTVASRCQFEPDFIRRMLAEGSASNGSNGTNGSNGGYAANGAGRGPGRNGRSNGQSPRAAGLSATRDTPELEALRLAVHRGSEVLDQLVPELFIDDLCATVYQLLRDHSSLHQVIEQGGPEVAEFVQRLSVEESTAEVDDVVALLWRGFVQRQMDDRRLRARGADADTAAELAKDFEWFRWQLEDLQAPDRKAATVQSLLGWVLEEAEEVL